MPTVAPELLYILDEDLYRLGNATSPRLDHVRPNDISTYERNGIVVLRANGFGISLITEARLQRIASRAAGYVWKCLRERLCRPDWR